jgi:hypothetical protein
VLIPASAEPIAGSARSWATDNFSRSSRWSSAISASIDRACSGS